MADLRAERNGDDIGLVAGGDQGVKRAAFWLLVLSSYGGSLGLLMAAVLGTRDSTPLHGAAQSASAWKEAVVLLLLTVDGIALVVGCIIALRGLERGTRAEILDRRFKR